MTISWHQATIDDRGLTFGDGCFETIRFSHGVVPLWQLHKQRLLNGLQRLGIDAEDDVIEQLLQEALTQRDEGIFKLIVTRGSGGRGYSAEGIARANYYPRVFPLKKPTNNLLEHGISVGLSSVSLARQPLLAGIKHLNRLEQVLAKQEVDLNGWDDAVLLDANGVPAELTAMNIFLRFDDGWWTPALKDCGVHGVAREWLLTHQPTDFVVSNQPSGSIYDCHEAFATNSIMGVIPISELAANQLTIGETTRYWQSQWSSIWHD